MVWPLSSIALATIWAPFRCLSGRSKRIGAFVISRLSIFKFYAVEIVGPMSERRSWTSLRCRRRHTLPNSIKRNLRTRSRECAHAGTSACSLWTLNFYSPYYRSILHDKLHDKSISFQTSHSYITSQSINKHNGNAIFITACSIRFPLTFWNALPSRIRNQSPWFSSPLPLLLICALLSCV